MTRWRGLDGASKQVVGFCPEKQVISGDGAGDGLTVVALVVI
ncbi:hypothetical protein [Gynuella sp.]